MNKLYKILAPSTIAVLLLVSALVPYTAEAAITVPQNLGHLSCTECVTSPGSFATLPAAGSTIVVTISYFSISGSGFIAPTDVTDNQGHSSYSLARATQTGGANSVAYIYYITNISAPSGTYTVTISNGNGGGGGFFEWTAAEVDGMGTVGVDQSATSNAGGSTSVTTGTVGPTGTTAQPSEIAFGVMSIQNTQVNTISTPSGYTQLYVQNDTGCCQGGSADYQILSSTGTQTATWSWGFNADFSGMLATFQNVMSTFHVQTTQLRGTVTQMGGTITQL